MPAFPKYDRPDPSEFAPFYAGYIAKVPEGDLVGALESNLEEFSRTIGALAEVRGGFAYAPGKWTLKEVIGHVIDAERVFSYRAMRIARGDETPLPGFDEKAWVPRSGSNDRAIADLLAELRAVRAATIALLRYLPEDSVARRGTASGNGVTVRALAWIIAGHSMHHLGIVRERYLV
jgi:hypothetical protein